MAIQTITGRQIKADTIDETHIDFGTGAGQVSGADLPLADSNDYFTGSDVETVLDEIGETRAINGYDLTTAASLPDISFSNISRILTLSVKGGSSNYYFWVNSIKIIKTGDSTVEIPDTTGTYYVYFDNTGTLQYVLEGSLVPAQFYENAISALVYWNATAGTSFVGNELHGKLMDARTHHFNHVTMGARYESGLAITGLTDGGDTYTNISSGYFWDEDIRHTIALTTTTSFLYRLGATGEWTGTTAL